MLRLVSRGYVMHLRDVNGSECLRPCTDFIYSYMYAVMLDKHRGQYRWFRPSFSVHRPTSKKGTRLTVIRSAEGSV